MHHIGLEQRMESRSATEQLRVLVVDDHRISGQFMAAALRQITQSVKLAETAREAMAIADEWRPQVIVLDVQLPDARGPDVARRVRRRCQGACEPPRIVFVSASHPADAGTADSFSSDGYLIKPVSARDLLNAIAPLHKRPPAGPDTPTLHEMQRLFGAELTTQLAPLDHCLATRDLAGARAILHRLIASSGLSRQRRLERDLRALHAVCGTRALAGPLARDYFAVLSGAREFLYALGHPDRSLANPELR